MHIYNFHFANHSRISGVASTPAGRPTPQRLKRLAPIRCTRPPEMYTAPQIPSGYATTASRLPLPPLLDSPLLRCNDQAGRAWPWHARTNGVGSSSDGLYVARRRCRMYPRCVVSPTTDADARLRLCVDAPGTRVAGSAVEQSLLAARAVAGEKCRECVGLRGVDMSGRAVVSCEMGMSCYIYIYMYVYVYKHRFDDILEPPGVVRDAAVRGCVRCSDTADGNEGCWTGPFGGSICVQGHGECCGKKLVQAGSGSCTRPRLILSFSIARDVRDKGDMLPNRHHVSAQEGTTRSCVSARTSALRRYPRRPGQRSFHLTSSPTPS